ncbi:hypothetical protein E2562_035148 [Oryza meyeriana var. granulata]|uniref:Uncharacterized protein n=1 Tax=Oryza meyeriana var. granulata TaxID=110450 RepID=A0A6G1E5Q3_9ORYZ|nr:hypothetical protein E2562_035148 [Oryza meyeriana var. granulata]
MVTAPQSVWDTFTARKNKDALHWRDKLFPYFDDLAPLYDGRYAEGKTRHGMDHYTRKTMNGPAHSTQDTNKEEIERFVAIEEKKLKDPYSINKCITVLEGLHGLQIGDILVTADIFNAIADGAHLEWPFATFIYIKHTMVSGAELRQIVPVELSSGRPQFVLWVEALSNVVLA